MKMVESSAEYGLGVKAMPGPMRAPLWRVRQYSLDMLVWVVLSKSLPFSEPVVLSIK